MMMRSVMCSIGMCTLGAVVAACGGGGGGGGSGSLSLGVTDAPVDDATSVVVTVDGLELLRGDDEIVEVFTFDPPRMINLYALQGGNVAPLLIDETVLAGEYDQIRLLVDAFDIAPGCMGAPLNSSPTFLTVDPVPSDDPEDIIDSGVDRFPMCIPSSSNTGLKLVSGFTVPVDGDANVTIDFDLRKAVTAPAGVPFTNPQKYFLRPALRLVENDEVGSIAGTVDPSLLDSVGDGCSDDDPLTGNAVYVFDGSDVEPDDIDEADPEPVTTAAVVFDDVSDVFEYVAAFLPAGPYTVAFTCQADLDVPPEPEDSNDGNDDIVFQQPANVVVVAGETTEHDFVP